MKGADIVYFESANSPRLVDAFSLDYAQPTPDTSQDWTLISSSYSGGILTVEATRALDTRDPQDLPFLNDAFPAIDGTRVIAAWGPSDSIQRHSLTDRLAAQVRFHGDPPADPLAAVRADPSVRSFDIVQREYAIPVTPTTYAHQCVPLSAARGGPVPAASAQHIVAVEYIPDTIQVAPP
jgi:hypothetical protein